MGKKDDNIKYVDGCPDWMLTLGDCMSLLVTFFVMLLSFSTPNKDKLQDALEGMKGALSVMSFGDTASQTQDAKRSRQDSTTKVDTFGDDGGKSESVISPDKLAVVNLKSNIVTNRFNDFKERVLELGFHKFVMAKQLDRGICIEIPFDTLFEKNSSVLLPDSFKLLQSFANLASSIDNEICMTAVFNPNFGGGSVVQRWNHAREMTFAVGNAFIGRYSIQPQRFTYGYEISVDVQKPFIRIMLAEKLGVSKISIDELISFQQEI